MNIKLTSILSTVSKFTHSPHTHPHTNTLHTHVHTPVMHLRFYFLTVHIEAFICARDPYHKINYNIYSTCFLLYRFSILNLLFNLCVMAFAILAGTSSTVSGVYQIISTNTTIKPPCYVPM